MAKRALHILFLIFRDCENAGIILVGKVGLTVIFEFPTLV